MHKKIFVMVLAAISIMAAGCGKTEETETLGTLDGTTVDTGTSEGTEEGTSGTELARDTPSDGTPEENEPVQFDSAVYTFPYDASEYISIGDFDYDSLEVPEIEPDEVTDYDVLTEIRSRIKQADKMEVTTSGTVENYDTIIVDYKGTVDGEEFDNNSAEGKEMTIGYNTYCKELEAGIVGKNIGEEFTVSVTLPSSFGDWAGKTADYTVTVQSVKSYPSLTDSLAAELSGQEYQTADEYRAYIREALEEQELQAAQYYAFKQMLAQIGDHVVFLQDLPEEEATPELTDEEIGIQAMLFGMTEEGAKKHFAEGGALYNAKSEDERKEYLALQKIAQDRGIVIYQDEIDELRESYIESGYTEEVIDAMLTEEDIAMKLLLSHLEDDFLGLG